MDRPVYAWLLWRGGESYNSAGARLIGVYPTEEAARAGRELAARDIPELRANIEGFKIGRTVIGGKFAQQLSPGYLLVDNDAAWPPGYVEVVDADSSG